VQEWGALLAVVMQTYSRFIAWAFCTHPLREDKQQVNIQRPQTMQVLFFPQLKAPKGQRLKKSSDQATAPSPLPAALWHPGGQWPILPSLQSVLQVTVLQPVNSKHQDSGVQVGKSAFMTAMLAEQCSDRSST